MSCKNLKDYVEYQTAVQRIAKVSELLNKKLDEEGLDLFEEYGNLYESIIKYDYLNKKAC